MTLPKIEHPISLIHVHSLNKDIKFRPFLVKEEKILLIAKESKNSDEIRIAIKQIIQNCVLEPLDVDKLPLFDVEMIFVKIRARSVGEAVQLEYNCQIEVDGVPCNTDTSYKLDLAKITLETQEGHSNIVKLTDKMGLKLKYPTLDVNQLVAEDENPYDRLLEMVVENIECIFDGESIHKPENYTSEELLDFMSGLTVEHMALIENFFRTEPTVVLNDTVKCSKCGFEHKIHTEGLLSFFL